MHVLIIIILISTLCTVWGSVNQMTKLWIPNTSFANPSNWNLERVPCEKDRVIFPLGLELGVTLPDGVTILRELVLARTGELFLPTDGALQIGGVISDKSSECKGEDITFMRQATKSWLDPSNWQDLVAGWNKVAGHSGPIPHTDRIPCDHDEVIFNPDNSFRVQLPEVDVKVGQIHFGDHQMSNAEWGLWLRSESGYRQFVGRDEDREKSVTIQPSTTSRCANKTGCACHAENTERILKEVCHFESRHCVATLPCYSPVTPYGHCCPICGAFLLLKYDQAFDIEYLQEMLDMEDHESVLIYAKKTTHSIDYDYIQIVIVENHPYDGTSGKLAAELADDIIKDMDLGVRKVFVHSAGPAFLGSKLAQAARTVFSTFFAVFLSLALVFYVFVVYRQGRPFSSSNYNLFQFARFENALGEEDGVLAIGNNHNASASVDNDAASPSKAFDNPMYGASTKEDNKRTGFDTSSGTAPTEVTHENPVYSELKRREDIKEETVSDVDANVGKIEVEEADVEDEEDESNEAEFHEILINKSE